MAGGGGLGKGQSKGQRDRATQDIEGQMRRQARSDVRSRLADLNNGGVMDNRKGQIKVEQGTG